MSESAYYKARKLALKEYHARIQRGENPFLPVLADIEEELNALSRQSLGLIQVPMSKVAGTVSRGRTNAFAANFMPLLDQGSEFSQKWNTLYNSVVEQGVREPVKAYEYLNRYYLLEGNKRVSVMKYLDAVAIEAEVTRVIPARTDDPVNQLYFEYLPFYADTQINYIWFSKPGGFATLYELTGHTPGEKWTGEERTDFEAAYMRFRAAYKAREDTRRLPITTGDAFLIYLKAIGYAEAPHKYDREIKSEVSALWGEFEKDKQQENVELIMQPTALKQGKKLMTTLFGPTFVKVAFLYSREPSESGWIYWHDLGRINLENALGTQVITTARVCPDPEQFEAEIEKLIDEDNALIFTTSPVMLAASMKASVKHPNARILNCSLLASWQRVRSYYLRIYEAKFLVGMIAGAMTETGHIGYLADYPICGMASSINAFAMGARMVNPRAKVILAWSTREDFDPEQPFADPTIDVISSRDVSAPRHQDVEYGLYSVRDGEKRSLAIPVFDWGRTYESLTRSVLNGTWKENGAEAAKAVNYWWGLNSDALDIVMSEDVGSGLRRLVELVKAHIREGVFWPFEGLMRDQAGVARCPADGRLSPADVIAMNWLTDNVVGGFPETGALKPQARALVELQGIREVDLPDASQFSWKAEEKQ
ncbi:MAG: BMP family ABC transporter substrate-binding protein [Clostridia bacterium]|nr:BMP family ABC transporter substrate-binding protein [Clostridia bacterium]